MTRRKILILLLVPGIASLANATIIDVVTVGPGDMGHTGASDDPLWVGETIEIKMVLNADPNPTWYNGGGYPAYDGYWLSVMDVDLTVTGPGALSELDGVAHPMKHDSAFATWAQPVPLISDNAIAYLSGTASGNGIQGEADLLRSLIWNLKITCTGSGVVTVDLGIKGLNQYSLYANSVGGSWITMTEDDLGDLVLYVPKPMTIALLGLGGLLLR